MPSFKFLGSTICQSLKWEVDTNLTISKAHQRLHFLPQLRTFGVARDAMLQFYRATMKCSGFLITVWYGNPTSSERKQLEKVVHTASKIIGQPSHLKPLSTPRVPDIKRRKCKMIPPTLPGLSANYCLLERVQRLRGKTFMFSNRTYPATIRLLNAQDSIFLLV